MPQQTTGIVPNAFNRKRRWGLVLLLPLLVASSATGQDTGSGDTTNAPPATSDASTNNAPAPTPDAVAAIQQQRQQLLQQLGIQLQNVGPDERIGMLTNFQQQLAGLLTPIQPPPLTQDQIAQQVAQQQANLQALLPTLSPDFQTAVSAQQQQLQLVQQLATAATPEDRLAILGQIHQAAAQADQASSDTDNITTAPLPMPDLSVLSPDLQAAAQAKIQRLQAIQAALQLSPDERVAALQAIQTPATTDTNSTAASNSTTTSAQP